MAHFTLIKGIPDLPPYLFEADVAIAVIPPQSYTVVPTSDTRVFLNWIKDRATTDDGFLYSEVYRSTNLTDWYLIATLDYPTASYYDHNVQVGLNYYYKVRFVRIDAEGYIINTSNYTIPLAATPVSNLSFEPRDIYANKFFKFLIDAMPGMYIYDHTDAAWFLSNKEYLWQTTCRILDGFVVNADGSPVARENPDPTALYAKRNVGFFLGNKHVNLLGVEASTGAEGELIQVSQYLIYTFLMGYAIQFMHLYEWYKEIVASKYIDSSQLYSKGFRPIVSAEASPTIAELYDTFGKMLNLEPLRSYSPDQGLVAYKNMLKSSFSNIDNVGKLSAINEACKDTLGITTQNVFNYCDYPWFRASRAFKLFAAPVAGAVGTVFGYATHSGIPVPSSTPWTPANANVSMKYTSLKEQFNLFVEYLQDDTVTAPKWAYVLADGSSPSNPYSYVVSVHMSIGTTLAADIPGLISASPSVGWLVSAAASDGSLGGTLMAQDRFRLQRWTPWLAWEQSMLKQYGRSFLLKDASASLTNVTDTCNFGAIIAVSNPNSTLLPGAAMTGSVNKVWDSGTNTWVVDTLLPPLFPTSVIVERDDASEGCSYEYFVGASKYAATHTGTKKALIKMYLTPSGMTWVTEAKFTLNIRVNTRAGFLRIYRLKKDYNQSSVCWNCREKQTTTGWQWNGATLSYSSYQNMWTTKYWTEVGANDTSDAILLTEVFIPEIAYTVSGTPFNIDLTEVMQKLYKYESGNLNMGLNDPENILNCGFMISAESLPNKSICVFDLIPSSTPTLNSKKMGEGFTVAPDDIEYLYVDGTTRYGRLLVMTSNREPQNYIRTVYERIPKADILMASGIILKIGTVPTAFIAGSIIYGTTSKAVGKIVSVGADTLTISEEVKHFTAGETIRLLSDATSTLGSATISSIDRNGLKKVRLARTPIKGSILQVYYTGSDLLPDPSYPTSYPQYAQYYEGMDGLWPIFISTLPASATRLYFAEQNSEDMNFINLNTTMSLDTLGDVIVLYQYDYQFMPMGRVTADSQYINNIEGCQRPDSNLYAQADNDMKYRSSLMLPKASDGLLVDMSGDERVNEYSIYNQNILANAVHNIRRLDGKVDVFKYDPTIKPYKFGEQYHTYLKGV